MASTKTYIKKKLQEDQPAEAFFMYASKA